MNTRKCGFRYAAEITLYAVLSQHTAATAQTYYDIHPGQEAIISFHLGSLVTDRVPNILTLAPGGGLGWHETSTTYSLYDGNNLLGSVTRGGDQSFNGQTFRSFDNPSNFFFVAPSVPVDFSSLRDGTIQGRLIYEPHYTNPDPTDYAHLEFEVWLYQQASASGGWLTRTPVIDGVQIVAAPEPRYLTTIWILTALVIAQRHRLRTRPRKSLQ